MSKRPRATTPSDKEVFKMKRQKTEENMSKPDDEKISECNDELIEKDSSNSRSDDEMMDINQLA